jgi:hypothetical protein
VRATCAKRQESIIAMFPVVAAQQYMTELPVTVKTPKSLAPANLAKALDRVDEIEAWCRDVRAEALRRALADEKIPGWKLVEGKKGNRKWNSETDVTLRLREIMRKHGIGELPGMYTKPELESPAGIERAVKGKTIPKEVRKEIEDALHGVMDDTGSFWLVEPLYTQPPGPKSLARDYDQRPALQLAPDVSAFPVVRGEFDVPTGVLTVIEGLL